MDIFGMGDFNFLIFLLPGFITVWSFRYLTRSTKKGEFELIGLSFLWGMILTALLGFLSLIPFVPPFPDTTFQTFYSVGLALSGFGFLLGIVGAYIVHRKWFSALKEKFFTIIER